MPKFIESTIEQAALEWLKDMGCQRIAFGETDTCTALRRKCKRMKTDSWVLASLPPKLMRGKVRLKDVEV